MSIRITGPDADGFVWLRLTEGHKDTALSFQAGSMEGRELLRFRDDQPMQVTPPGEPPIAQ